MTAGGGETAEREPVRIPIEDSIDLHTFRPAEVASVVEEYLREAIARGLRSVRIIHGRGIGVQREIVQSLLRRHPAVLSIADAPDRGATMVTLAAEVHTRGREGTQR